MKVVIFCGGMGVRMGDATQRTPKPMIPVGSQPILWHVMKWYASWGHKEFILCLGYQAEVIKGYFLAYNEALGNNFVLARLLREHHASQLGKRWFDDEPFRGLLRLRGVESGIRYAEAFTCRKLTLLPA